jgi:predicted nucleic acid-binding protein
MDSSMALAWIYSEETTPGVREVYARLEEHGAWVPGLWRLEVANALEMGVRRGRRDAAFVRATLADLALWPVKTDRETDRRAWSDTLRLAREHRLTLYDAAYLELAVRRGLPLATLDRDLGRAAGESGMIRLG